MARHGFGMRAPGWWLVMTLRVVNDRLAAREQHRKVEDV
jgi:hypothetical protein